MQRTRDKIRRYGQFLGREPLIAGVGKTLQAKEADLVWAHHLWYTRFAGRVVAWDLILSFESSSSVLKWGGSL